MSKSLTNFIESVKKQGGFSFSNNYDVDFIFKDSTGPLVERMNRFGISFTNGNTISSGDTGGEERSQISSGGLIKMLCDEAQLPNVQASTGQITGRYLGEGIVNYPHTRLYSDFSLGWMGDSNMLPLKFVNLWYGYIFGEYNAAGEEIAPRPLVGNNLSSVKQVGSTANAARQVRLSYPEKYLCNITITKTDKGPDAPNQRTPISYTLVDAFPYSIDTVPLSYGASQIVKVTTNFYYSKHYVTYNNISLS